MKHAHDTSVVVGRRILDHQLGLAVDGQDQGVPGLSEAVEQIFPWAKRAEGMVNPQG
jgi:hypothetical protein